MYVLAFGDSASGGNEYCLMPFLCADHDEHAPETNTSSATCSVVAIGYSEAENTKLIADVGTHQSPAANHPCRTKGTYLSMHLVA